jgi:hypothetical protein
MAAGFGWLSYGSGGRSYSEFTGAAAVPLGGGEARWAALARRGASVAGTQPAHAQALDDSAWDADEAAAAAALVNGGAGAPARYSGSLLTQPGVAAEGHGSSQQPLWRKGGCRARGRNRAPRCRGAGAHAWALCSADRRVPTRAAQATAWS